MHATDNTGREVNSLEATDEEATGEDNDSEKEQRDPPSIIDRFLNILGFYY